MAVLCTVCVLIFAIAKIPQPGKCLINEAIFRVNKEEYLTSYVIETKQAESELKCGMHCVAKESCASINYKTSGVGKGLCELNSKPSPKEISKRLHKPEFNHLYIIKKVGGCICSMNATSLYVLLSRVIRTKRRNSTIIS